MTNNEILQLVNLIANIVTIIAVAWSRAQGNRRIEEVKHEVRNGNGHADPPDF